jgi:hypothetical protein
MAGRLIVYLAVATELVLLPEATAIAETVSDLATVIGSGHTEEDVDGVDPSVVQ